MNILFCLYIIVISVFFAINKNVDYNYYSISRFIISLGTSIITLIYLKNINIIFSSLKLISKIITIFFMLGHVFFVFFGSYLYYYELSRTTNETLASLFIICAMLFVQALNPPIKKLK